MLCRKKGQEACRIGKRSFDWLHMDHDAEAARRISRGRFGLTYAC
uniref:Uncharacterized protein n=1 Tax=Anguilla anguilla TaxID=7936 RepID=A0A0E9UJD1_ANGAN